MFCFIFFNYKKTILDLTVAVLDSETVDKAVFENTRGGLQPLLSSFTLMIAVSQT